MHSHPTAKSSSAHRLPGLDGLRAISIALVIAYHLRSIGPLTSVVWINNLCRNGGFGVDIFFTISGFLITWLLLREESAHGSISLKQFYARRAVRILPPAMAYLVVILIVSLLRGTMGWQAWIASALFYRNLIKGDFFSPQLVNTGHYWSLAVEEQFYLFWPLLFLLLRPKLRVPFLVIAFLALPPWRQLNYHWYQAANVKDERLDFRGDGIVIGCLLACVTEDSRFRKILSHRLLRGDGIVILCTAIIVATFTAVAVQMSGKIVFSYFSIRAVCVALILNRIIHHTADEDSILFRLLNLNLVVMIGRLSYSIYLWQQPFCDFGGLFWTKSKTFDVLASVGCGVLSFLLIELPSQSFRKKLGSRTAPRPAGS